MAQVQRIDPIIMQDGKETVAAYCRVSTDSKDQLNSYNAQIAYYTQLIANNPDWELADIYADRGLTGTSIDKRDEFKRMLEDCRAGKIKRVLVKSVSDGKLYELDQAIAALNDKALVLQRLSNKGFITPEEFRAQNDVLATERKRLTAQRKKKLAGSPVHSAMEKLEELQSILASWPGVPTEFDINVFDEIVEKIIPIDNNTLKFRLHCGLELTEVIPT